MRVGGSEKPRGPPSVTQPARAETGTQVYLLLELLLSPPYTLLSTDSDLSFQLLSKQWSIWWSRDLESLLQAPANRACWWLLPLPPSHWKVDFLGNRVAVPDSNGHFSWKASKLRLRWLLWAPGQVYESTERREHIPGEAECGDGDREHEVASVLRPFPISSSR